MLGSYGMATGTGDERKALQEQNEQRGAELRTGKTVSFNINEMSEFRSIAIGGGTLVVPKHYSPTLNETFNEVSSVIDVVNAFELPGGESYEKGFVKGWGEGDYTTETGDYAESDPVFDYESVGKAKITVYSEMSDESAKLPNVNYQALAARNISIALRKKVARQFILGAGSANTIKGIFNAPAKVIPVASDIEITTIDANTLDKIIFGFGGEEDVEGGACLILNKIDLAAFAAVRATDGKKLYNIEFDGNKGTISSDGSYKVNFILNSACSALSNVGTKAGTYCMAYGFPRNYEMPIFSPVEIMESREFKFRSGQLAFRGTVWIGGALCAWKGFVRVKKGVAK